MADVIAKVADVTATKLESSCLADVVAKVAGVIATVGVSSCLADGNAKVADGMLEPLQRGSKNIRSLLPQYMTIATSQVIRSTSTTSQ